MFIFAELYTFGHTPRSSYSNLLPETTLNVVDLRYFIASKMTDINNNENINIKNTLHHCKTIHCKVHSSLCAVLKMHDMYYLNV